MRPYARVASVVTVRAWSRGSGRRGPATVVVLAMLPFGFTVYPLGALVGLVLRAILGVGIGSLSYALALAVRKQDWMLWVVQQTVLFPIMILSGMLLPLDGGPGWIQALAKANPLTYVVDAERALFAGDLTSSVVLGGSWLRP